MGSLLAFLLAYIIGGLTFPFVLFALVFAHAYCVLPVRGDAARLRDTSATVDSLVQPGDDVEAIDHIRKNLEEKFQPRASHETDVAAGYFAVSRDYIPGGVNGRPPERATPIGPTTVSAASPSVYQSMYRSIFERKPSSSPLDNKGTGKPVRRGSNIFYVVLRHGHLMLFDDEEQLEVRHVVSLAHHNVSIYSGGNDTPEGELFIRRNALCLFRRSSLGDTAPDGQASKPFFLFSDNCSEKEDFYFALLRNQENHPTPLQYDIKDIITLVQKLHSSEEHLQTRWINALIGRVFLALYRTSEVEKFIRAKIAKKVSRVKTPNFLSRIALRNVGMGQAAPVITNPRLKDLTVDGELVVEADVRYSGNFRIEVAATARIDLGTRFKAREVDLLLAVNLKRIEGHILFRMKPPPSNRFWMCFQTQPKIDMSIEPIVSSRQITYTLILRQIETRIKEVIAESLVFPNWDDFPFYGTESKLWRGGLWEDDATQESPEDTDTLTTQTLDMEEIENLESERDESTVSSCPQVDINTNVPTASLLNTLHSRKAAKSSVNLTGFKSGGSSTSIDPQSSTPVVPVRTLHSGSFASIASPIVSTDVTIADAFKSTTSPEHSEAMAAISALSQTNSPTRIPVGSPSLSSRIENTSIHSMSSIESVRSMKEQDGPIPQPFPDSSKNISQLRLSTTPPSVASVSHTSFPSETPNSSMHDMRRENSSSSSGKSAETKRLSLAAAAATAKKWGWNALQRNTEQKSDPDDANSRPLVMGRGQPLPPPGVPLPPPGKKTKTAPTPVPKRRAMPPHDQHLQGQRSSLHNHLDSVSPSSPRYSQNSNETKSTLGSYPTSSTPPPLPRRRRQDEATDLTDCTNTDDGLLVVPAPDADNLLLEDDEASIAAPRIPPRLPVRQPVHRVLSRSTEEDGQKLPSWMAAQEQEARVRSAFVDEDTGLP